MFSPSSRAGLEARGLQGCKGRTEAAFLDVLDETAATGRTAAENLLALYNGSWGGNIDRVFRDFAYSTQFAGCACAAATAAVSPVTAT